MFRVWCLGFRVWCHRFLTMMNMTIDTSYSGLEIKKPKPSPYTRKVSMHAPLFSYRNRSGAKAYTTSVYASPRRSMQACTTYLGNAWYTLWPKVIVWKTPLRPKFTLSTFLEPMGPLKETCSTSIQATATAAAPVDRWEPRAEEPDAPSKKNTQRHRGGRTNSQKHRRSPTPLSLLLLLWVHQLSHRLSWPSYLPRRDPPPQFTALHSGETQFVIIFPCLGVKGLGRQESRAYQ